MTTAVNTEINLSDEEVKKALATAAKRKENAALRASMTPEQRAEAKAKEDQEKADRKAQREKERAAKNANKAEAPAAHMTKVFRARQNLPELVGTAKTTFGNIISTLNVLDISNLVANLAQFVRERQTETALKTELTEGQTVRILRGSDRFNGQLAEVTKTGRIRCYVKPIGHDKSVYLFTADVEAVEALTNEGTSPEVNENDTQENESKVA